MRIVVLLRAAQPQPAAARGRQLADDYDASGVPTVTGANAHAPLGLAPCERAALALALRLSDGEPVTVLTAGAEVDEVVLARGVSLGAMRAVRVCGDAIDWENLVELSRAIATGVAQLGYDLVLAGERSVNWGTGTTGPAVAHQLGVPHLRGVVDVAHSSLSSAALLQLADKSAGTGPQPRAVGRVDTGEASVGLLAQATRAETSPRVDAEADTINEPDAVAARTDDDGDNQEESTIPGADERVPGYGAAVGVDLSYGADDDPTTASEPPAMLAAGLRGADTVADVSLLPHVDSDGPLAGGATVATLTPPTHMPADNASLGRHHTTGPALDVAVRRARSLLRVTAPTPLVLTVLAGPDLPASSDASRSIAELEVEQIETGSVVTGEETSATLKAPSLVASSLEDTLPKLRTLDAPTQMVADVPQLIDSLRTLGVIA